MCVSGECKPGSSRDFVPGEVGENQGEGELEKYSGIAIRGNGM